ncbi:MAG: aldehyde dehydrogenase (NADP(+)) [Planctomycetaceae bacterium]
MSVRPILIDGEWTPSAAEETFRPANPAARQPLDDEYPVSPRDEVERAIQAAADAFAATAGWPGERFAAFLDAYAARIDARADEIIELAHAETALPVAPRLREVELPRTVNQLRQAASAAREGSWSLPTIDVKNNIRSLHAPIGPVAVFGPNNFPFAFNSIAGGDFAAAVAAGNPVIAKGHSLHPGTTRLFAEEAQAATEETEMPAGFVQLLYRTSHEDGALLVSHPLMGAAAYTGSRTGGLALKQAADRAGKPIYLELSSINPVFVLPGAVEERIQKLVDEFTASCLMGAGQFCTNPGLVVLLESPETDAFQMAVAARFDATPPGTLLAESVLEGLAESVERWRAAGAKLVTGGKPVEGRLAYANTLLRIEADAWLKDPDALQTEAFGNATLFVIARDAEELLEVANSLEGNLTGAIYSDTRGGDDALAAKVERVLRRKVGRLLNDKMPTGVAVSPAMNHGGPFPATGHPGFTAVGVPASLRRFSALHCYDNVRPQRLPIPLRDPNSTGDTWRLIDGLWTREAVVKKP